MSNFSAIPWREQVTFCWDDDVCIVLDQHDELNFFIVIAHWNNNPWVAPLVHIIPIVSQPVL